MAIEEHKFGVQVEHESGNLVVKVRIEGPRWAMGMDPDDALRLYEKALSESLVALWQKTMDDHHREMIHGKPGGIQNPRGLLSDA